jgi:hypothetical protein
MIIIIIIILLLLLLLGWANTITISLNNANQKDIFGALSTEMSSRNWGGVGRNTS